MATTQIAFMTTNYKTFEAKLKETLGENTVLRVLKIYRQVAHPTKDDISQTTTYGDDPRLHGRVTIEQAGEAFRKDDLPEIKAEIAKNRESFEAMSAEEINEVMGVSIAGSRLVAMSDDEFVAMAKEEMLAEWKSGSIKELLTDIAESSGETLGQRKIEVIYVTLDEPTQERTISYTPMLAKL